VSVTSALCRQALPVWAGSAASTIACARRQQAARIGGLMLYATEHRVPAHPLIPRAPET
jgi:hypothetical protein